MSISSARKTARTTLIVAMTKNYLNEKLKLNRLKKKKTSLRARMRRCTAKINSFPVNKVFNAPEIRRNRMRKRTNTIQSNIYSSYPLEIKKSALCQAVASGLLARVETWVKALLVGCAPHEITAKKREIANMVNREGEPLMLVAARWGFSDVVHFLAKLGADIGRKGNEGLSPVHLAAIRGHVGTVLVLQDYGALLTANDMDLLKRKARLLNPQSLDRLRRIASDLWVRRLTKCIEKKYNEGIRLTLKLNSSETNVVNARFPGSATENTMLHECVERGLDQAVGLLIQEGANVNMTNIMGATPLVWSLVFDKAECLRQFIKEGVFFDNGIVNEANGLKKKLGFPMEYQAKTEMLISKSLQKEMQQNKRQTRKDTGAQARRRENAQVWATFWKNHDQDSGQKSLNYFLADLRGGGRELSLMSRIEEGLDFE